MISVIYDEHLMNDYCYIWVAWNELGANIYHLGQLHGDCFKSPVFTEHVMHLQ